MKHATTEIKDIDEFDLMPCRLGSGAILGTNHFVFNDDKIFHISDVHPNFKNIVKFFIRIEQKNDITTGNESVVQFQIIHTKK